MRRAVQLSFGLVACVLATGALAQIIHGTGTGHPSNNDPNARGARLFVSLTNADGSPVTGLRPENFGVSVICNVSIWNARVVPGSTFTKEVFPGDYYITVTHNNLGPASRCDGYIVKVGDRGPVGAVIAGGAPIFTQRGSFVVRTTSPMSMR